jgi:CHAD domain-containing protein
MTRNLARPVLLRRINRVLRFLPAAALCVPAGVHDARVATRRLREALPVLGQGKKGRALLRATRRVTRALGPVRELDVAMATLAEFGGSRGLSRESMARVRAALVDERQTVCARLQRRLDRCDIKGLGARVTEQTSTPLTTQAARTIVARVEVRCGRRAARLRGAIERAAGIYLPARLHEVRIAVKKLRYAMELAHDLRAARRTTRPSRASGSSRSDAARLRALRQAQDLMGRMNDLEMLTARLRALQGTSTVTGLRVSADLDQLVRRLEDECRVLHGRYMAARGGLLAVCDYAETTLKKHEDASRAA